MNQGFREAGRLAARDPGMDAPQKAWLVARSLVG